MVQILIRIARAVLKMVLQQLMQQFNLLQEQVMSPMQKMIQQVTDGVWIGEGANAFVDEVSSIMIPGVGRVADDVDFFRNGLQKAEEIIKKRGIKESSLFVDTKNDLLKEWYKKQDYKKTTDWTFMYKKL